MSAPTVIDYARGLASKYARTVGCAPEELLGLAWQACTAPGVRGWPAARYRMIDLMRRDPIYAKSRHAKRRLRFASLHEPLNLADMLRDPRCEDPALVAERRDGARAALDAMSPTDRAVTRLRFGAGLDLAVVGRWLGFSESRACSCLKRGLRAARRALEASA